MLTNDFEPWFVVVRLQPAAQKDMRLALELSDSVHQSMPCVSASNELYKRAMSANFGDRDMASVYRVVNEHTNRLSDL